MLECSFNGDLITPLGASVDDSIERIDLVDSVNKIAMGTQQSLTAGGKWVGPQVGEFPTSMIENLQHLGKMAAASKSDFSVCVCDFWCPCVCASVCLQKPFKYTSC